MKHMNKILALVLALTMVLGLAISASAVTIKVVESADGDSVAGHTYNVYQIFTGTVAKDGVTLSDIVAGSNLADDADVDAILAEIADKSATEVAAYLNDLVTGDPYAVLNAENDWTVEDAPAGYYLIIDVSEGLPSNETASAYILQVLEDTEIKSKHESSPTTFKKVDDINDSTGEGSQIEWHDSADHDIGDLIDFQLNAILPNKFDSFKAHDAAYPFTFHDVENPGLKFDHIKEVYIIIDGIKVSLAEGTDYTLITETTDGCSFEVFFSDLTTIEGIKGGAQLVVEYQSVLTEDAIIGDDGNPNKMRGEFKNKYDDEEPDFTPWDTVIVFTFETDVNKVDKENKPLTGAEFKLEKFILDENGTDTYKVNDETTLVGTWKTLQTIKNDEGNVFSFKGLDDGYYRIVETIAPDGYNKIDPIYFQITAEHEIEADLPQLTSLSATQSEADKATGSIATFTVSKENGTISTDVINQQGTVLPETGGIGTTLFYVIGGLLAVVAVVLLVTKKRMVTAE